MDVRTLNDEMLDDSSRHVETGLPLAVAGTILPLGEGKLAWSSMIGAAG